ncbi:hypothetical protein BSKO_00563 [Bryopsis sp. KO-2023]|nr:hypothetical protein BSKO_00563 [Bryopsis sp. KO-2023]
MAFTMKTVIRGTPVANKTPATPVVRAVPVVRASAEESRRAVLGGLVAGVSLIASRAAQAAPTAIDLRDDRKVNETGFDLIYNARDLDLPQSTRDGFDQARASLDETKARIAESARRITGLKSDIEKAYWTHGREELRLQVGTLRFDLDTVINASGNKKAGKAAKQEFFAKVDDLDFALRSKNQEKAFGALDSVTAALATLS